MILFVFLFLIIITLLSVLSPAINVLAPVIDWSISYLKKITNSEINSFVEYEKPKEENTYQAKGKKGKKSIKELSELPVTFNKLEYYEMPLLSNDSKCRMSFYKKRKEGLNKVYNKSLLMTLIFYLVLFLCIYLLNTVIAGNSSALFSKTYISIFLIVPSIYLLIKSKIDLVGNENLDADSESLKNKIRKIFHLNLYQLHPKRKIMLVWLWMFFFLLTGSFGNSNVILLSKLSNLFIVPCTVGLFFWIYFSKKELVKEYPYQKPLNLLELRVFENSSFEDFIKLTTNWQWLGIRYRLDGPETTGSKFKDVLNYISGDIQKSIVKNEDELNKEIINFKKTPNEHLQFPLNSMQCDLYIWKLALQKLIKVADVVVMDLSDLKPDNKGVPFEIEQLINLFPKEKAIFLVNKNTDKKALKAAFTKAWDKIDEGSPNRYDKNITLYNYDDLRNKLADKIDNFETNYLSGLLYDKAKLMRNGSLKPDSKKDKRYINWANFPCSNLIRYLVRLLFIILLLLALKNLLYKKGSKIRYSPSTKIHNVN